MTGVPDWPGTDTQEPRFAVPDWKPAPAGPPVDLGGYAFDKPGVMGQPSTTTYLNDPFERMPPAEAADLKARMEESMGGVKFNRVWAAARSVEAPPPHVANEGTKPERQTFVQEQSARGVNEQQAKDYEEFQRALTYAQSERIGRNTDWLNNPTLNWALEQAKQMSPAYDVPAEAGKAFIQGGFLGPVEGGLRLVSAVFGTEPPPDLRFDTLAAQWGEGIGGMTTEQYYEHRKKTLEDLGMVGEVSGGIGDLASWLSPYTIAGKLFRGGAQALGLAGNTGRAMLAGTPLGARTAQLLSSIGSRIPTLGPVAGRLMTAAATQGASFGALQALRENYNRETGELNEAGERVMLGLHEAAWWPAYEIFGMAGQKIAQRILGRGGVTARQIMEETAEKNLLPRAGDDIMDVIRQRGAAWVADGKAAGLVPPSTARRIIAQTAATAAEATGFSFLDAQFRGNLAAYIFDGNVEAGQTALARWFGNTLMIGAIKAGSFQKIPDTQRLEFNRRENFPDPQTGKLEQMGWRKSPEGELRLDGESSGIKTEGGKVTIPPNLARRMKVEPGTFQGKEAQEKLEQVEFRTLQNHIDARRFLAGHEAETSGQNYIRPTTPEAPAKIVAWRFGRQRSVDFLGEGWQTTEVSKRPREYPNEADHAVGKELHQLADTFEGLVGPESADALRSAGRLLMERSKDTDPAVDNTLNLVRSGVVGQALRAAGTDPVKARAVLKEMLSVASGTIAPEHAAGALYQQAGREKPQETRDEGIQPESPTEALPEAAPEPGRGGQADAPRPREGAPARPDPLGRKRDAETPGEGRAAREVAERVTPENYKQVTKEAMSREAGVVDLETVIRGIEGKTASEVTEFGREVVREFGGEIEGSKIRSELTRRDVKKRFSEDARRDMIFFREKTDNPVTGETYRQMSSRMTQAEKDFVNNEFGPRMDAALKKMVENKLLEKDQQVKDYISHLWVGKKWKAGEVPERVVSWFKSKHTAAFLKKRKIPSYFEGMTKHDLVPRSLDIADILAYHENVVNTVLASEAVIRAIRDSKPFPDLDAPLITGEKTAPEGYVRAADHGMDVPSMKYGRPRDKSYYIHPDLVKPLKAIFETPLRPGNAFLALQDAAFLAKRMQLSLSAFHMFSLSESAFALAPAAAGLRGHLPGYTPWKIVRSIKGMQKNLERFGEDAARHGLQLSMTEDIGHGLRSQVFRDLAVQAEAALPKVITTLPKMVGKLQTKVLDKALWDYMHTGLKLEYWNAITQRQWSKPKVRAAYTNKHGTPEKALKQLKRDTANVMNDAFGGQNWWAWYHTMNTKKYRTMAQMALLAPDWTLSNLKIAGRGITALPFVPATSVSKSVARNYWFRMLVTAPVMMEAFQWMWLNFSPSVSDEDRKSLTDAGKTAHTWDNEQRGMRLYRDEQGRWVFAQPLKQVREIAGWIDNPLKEALVKASPVVKEVLQQAANEDVASGFPAPWEGENFWRSIPKRLASVAENYAPFSVTGMAKDTQIAFTMPARRGLTQFSATKRAMDLMTAYGLDKPGNLIDTLSGRTMDGDLMMERMDELIRSSQANNLNTKDIFRNALGKVRAELYKRWAMAIQHEDDETAQQMADALQRTHIPRWGSDPGKGAVNSLVRRFRELMRSGKVQFTEEEFYNAVLPREIQRLGKTIPTPTMAELEAQAVKAAR